MTFARCVSTVLTAIPSSAAVCLWDLPAPSRRMICRSRGVSFRSDNSAAGASEATSAPSKNPFRTISAALLLKKRLSRDTVLTAFTNECGKSDFKTYPLAPASKSRRTICLDSCIVRIRILVSGTAARSCRVASIPSNSGMVTSNTATSGFNFFAINLYPGTHRCPLAGRINFQPAAYLPHPLAHAGNAHSRKDLPDFLYLAAHSPAFISDFQYDLILDSFQPHRCAAAAGVALNVR